MMLEMFTVATKSNMMYVVTDWYKSDYGTEVIRPQQPVFISAESSLKSERTNSVAFSLQANCTLHDHCWPANFSANFQ
jgi:hypothetical protein